MKTIRLIETYLEGKLEGQELEEFLKKVENDGSFKHEVEFHREINEGILDDSFELREQIKNLLPSKKPVLGTILKIAVPLAAVFIIGMAVLTITRHENPDMVFKNFYSPYETDLNTRSGRTNYNDISQGCFLYQKEDYQQAYNLLRNYLSSTHQNNTALFYYGLSAIEINKNSEAEKSLKQLASDDSSSYSLHAKWYLSMLYLKEGFPAKAKPYLKQLAKNSNFYSTRAKKILRKYF